MYSNKLNKVSIAEFIKINIDEDFSLALETSISKQLWPLNMKEL